MSIGQPKATRAPRLLIVSTVAVTHTAFLTPFAQHYRSLGWRVDGMASGISESDARSSYDHVWDASWSRNPLDPRNLWRAAPEVRGVVEREGFDIVHVHTPVAGLVTRFALRKMRRSRGLKVVYTAHGFHFAPGLGRLRNALFVVLERLGGRWTDRLVVINGDDLEAAARLHIIDPARIRFIAGIGVDTDRFAPGVVQKSTVDAVRTEIGVAPDIPLLTMIAEFTPNKQHAGVLRAFAMTRRDSVLLLAGDGPNMDEARELARTLGIEARVRFLGWRPDVPSLIAASRATVLFSAREGLPRSSMESLAMAVPVIGPDIRGVRDLLACRCGVLVPPGDEVALAAAMDLLVSDEDLARTMGQRGREEMTGQYSLASVIAAHDELYAELLRTDPFGGRAPRPEGPARTS